MKWTQTYIQLAAKKQLSLFTSRRGESLRFRLMDILNGSIQPTVKSWVVLAPLASYKEPTFPNGQIQNKLQKISD
jgi:hypothetical protein